MYRHKRNYLNQQRRMYGEWECSENFGFPKMLNQKIPDDIFDAHWIPFNMALTEKEPENCVVHFFVDDYQFDRVWENPDRYIDLLSRFKAVCSPDFSMYIDFPLILQMYNHFRKMWCGRYWQDHGITVIPTLGWSDADSFEWCFDGIEYRPQVAAVATTGILKDKDVIERYTDGLNEAVRRIAPKKLVIVTQKENVMDMTPLTPENARKSEIILVKNSNLVRLKALRCKTEVQNPPFFC